MVFSESVCRELHLFIELRYILLQICNVSVKGGDAVDLTFYFVIPAYCPITSPDKTIRVLHSWNYETSLFRVCGLP